MRGSETPPIYMLSFASTSNKSAKLCKTKTRMSFLAPISRSEWQKEVSFRAMSWALRLCSGLTPGKEQREI